MTEFLMDSTGPFRVLVIAAHPDDEMGCGGFVARLVDRGAEIHHHYFSECDVSTVARGFEPRQLLDECNRSRTALGLDLARCGGFSYPVREFPAHRQEILDDLIELRRRIQPTLVLTATRADVHQDHSTLTTEAFRAFKFATILGYELPWNSPSMAHDVFVKLEKSHLERKIASVACYRSQQASPYCGAEAQEALARVRGLQCGTTYAECYELIRAVI